MPVDATVINNINIEEAFLWLVTFTDYEDTPETTIRAVNNLEDVVSRGETFTAFPFEITLPPDNGQKPQNLKMTFTNVSRTLMQLVREYDPSRPPKVLLELVLSPTPNDVEKSIDFMTVGSAKYDAQTITLELISSSIFARKTITATYNQAEFPGLFWALR